MSEHPESPWRRQVRMEREEAERRNHRPPPWAVAAACAAARRSPCGKSNRGVCIYRTDAEQRPDDPNIGPVYAADVAELNAFDRRVISVGWNAAPDQSCAAADLRHILDGSAVVGIANRRQPTDAEHAAAKRCESECGKRCVHAEVRAIRGAFAQWRGPMTMLEAVHVKVDRAGELVAGGGPSCWQCSREVADVGLGGFWLYEEGAVDLAHDAVSALEGAIARLTEVRHPPRWRRYTAAEFHRETLKACGLAVL